MDKYLDFFQSHRPWPKSLIQNNFKGLGNVFESEESFYSYFI